MKLTILRLQLVALTALLHISFTTHGGKNEFLYQNRGETYRYFVLESGDNYSFQFEKELENRKERRKAGLHVLESVYKDSDIDPDFSEHHVWEGADCFIFESTFYKYRICFFPDAFSAEHKNRFRGFVTRLSSWVGPMILIAAPALLIVGLYYWVRMKRA